MVFLGNFKHCAIALTSVRNYFETTGVNASIMD